MQEFKPFIINSNLCYEKEDIASFESYMKSIQYNIGNSYITYSLIKELCGGFKKVPHIQNIYHYDFANVDKDIDYINNECTHVFFMIQDFIRENAFPLPYERLIDMFERIEKPLIIAGIGANSFGGFDSKLHKKLRPEVVKFLKCISERCVQLGVRGHYTEEVLNNLGIHNVTAMGCPSFYEMGRDRYIRKNPIEGNLKSVLMSSAIRNKYLLESVQNCQDFQEINIIKTIAFQDLNCALAPEQQERVLGRKYSVFSSIEDWRTFVSQFNFTLGFRVHGSVVSLNAGVPAVCFNGDSRASEMCKLLKVPLKKTINYDMDILKLYDEVDVDAMNNSYPALYDNYLEFLAKNNLSIYKPQGNEVYDVQPSLQLYKNFKDSEDWKDQMRLRFLFLDLKQKNDKMCEEFKGLNSKLDEIIKNQSKPSFIQKIFSVKKEKNHIILKLLGIKFSIRRNA